MRFGILGPLEAFSGSRRLPLGPPRQRAVLGYLLLNANRVVPTSRLISALWSGNAPKTSRQMLQNAVSALRAVMTDSEAVLLSHTPGYLLRVDPAQIDLHRFQGLADRGMSLLAAGDADAAARTLREAVTLWRGSALADLAEGGIDWPEIVAIDNTRFDALEALFEAELARGRHQQVIGELVAAAQAKPERERLTEHAVVALNRCGRQREVRALLLGAGALPEQETPRDDAPVERIATGERKHISILLLITECDDQDPEDLAAAGERVSTAAREEVERFGGIVGGAVGPMSMALFGASCTREDDTRRSVRAALALVDRFASTGIRVRAAVATGETLVRHSQGEPPTVIGTVVDRCVRLAHLAGEGDVLVCDSTRARERNFVYRPAVSGGWSVSEIAQGDVVAPPSAPLIDRDRELAVLTALVDVAERRRRPQLITVLGEPGVGKSRLVAELVARTGGVVARMPSFDSKETTAVVESLMSTRGHDSAEVPLLLIEDVHHASGTALDMIGELADTTTVVVTARPELLEGRPGWASGRPRATTLTLDALSGEAIAQLVGAVLPESDPEFRAALADRVGGNPFFALEYARTAGPKPEIEELAGVPHAVRAVVEAGLDALPAGVKSVLQDAAIVDEVVWPDAVVAMGGRSAAEVTACFDELVRRGLLRPVDGTESGYTLRCSLVRDVARARLPRTICAERQQAAARWMAVRTTAAARCDLVS
jgi:DNA-binding SARP family transcriptional activator